MRVYEGLFIFPESLGEEELNEAVEKVKSEVGRVGGEVENTARMGRRPFARSQGKHTAGHYVIMNLKLDEQRMDDLKKRIKLGTEVFRSQFTRVEDRAAAGREA